MDHVLAVPYELCSSADRFVFDWNSAPSCAATAVASVPAEPPPDLMIDFVDAFLVVLGAVGTEISAQLLYDLVKRSFAPPAGKELVYRTTRRPDGTEVTELILK